MLLKGKYIFHMLLKIDASEIQLIMEVLVILAESTIVFTASMLLYFSTVCSQIEPCAI